jgi:hypothetical protein
LDVETRRVTFTLRIDERAEDGSNAVFTREFDVRLFSEGELRGLLQEAGFEVLDVYGDFDLSSPSDESELQLFRCKAA